MGACQPNFHRSAAWIANRRERKDVSMWKVQKGDPPETRDVMEDLPAVLLRVLSLADQVARRILDRMTLALRSMTTLWTIERQSLARRSTTTLALNELEPRLLGWACHKIRQRSGSEVGVCGQAKTLRGSVHRVLPVTLAERSSGSDDKRLARVPRAPLPAFLDLQ